MKLSSSVTLLAVLAGSASAFSPSQQQRSHRRTLFQLQDSLSSIAGEMAKANQEKAAAIQAAEAQNQADIEALKNQIAQIEQLFDTNPTNNNISGMKTALDSSSAQNNNNNAAQGPGLSDIVSTSIVAGTFGGLVTGALDNNRRDSIGGIIAGVAGASLAGGSSDETQTSSKAVPAFKDPRSVVSTIQTMMMMTNLRCCCCAHPHCHDDNFSCVFFSTTGRRKENHVRLSRSPDQCPIGRQDQGRLGQIWIRTQYTLGHQLLL